MQAPLSYQESFSTFKSDNHFAWPHPLHIEYLSMLHKDSFIHTSKDWFSLFSFFLMPHFQVYDDGFLTLCTENTFCAKCHSAGLQFAANSRAIPIKEPDTTKLYHLLIGQLWCFFILLVCKCLQFPKVFWASWQVWSGWLYFMSCFWNQFPVHIKVVQQWLHNVPVSLTYIRGFPIRGY